MIRQCGASLLPPTGFGRGRRTSPAPLSGWADSLPGVTGPLLSTFVPPLVRDALGDHRDGHRRRDGDRQRAAAPARAVCGRRIRSRGRARPRAPAAGSRWIRARVGRHGVLPVSVRFGIGGLITAIVLLYSGINLQRSPVQALVADTVSSRVPLARDGIGHVPDVRRRDCVPDAGPHARHVAGFRDRRRHGARHRGRICDWSSRARHAGLPCAGGNLRVAPRRGVRSAVRGVIPGMRAIFLASLLLQLTFQTFTTWYALHATQRFGIRPEDVTVGFIAWALGGVAGALPAGLIGVRLGRRNAMLARIRAHGSQPVRARSRRQPLAGDRRCSRWRPRAGRCRP